MPDDRKNNRRLKWLSQTLDKKTFDIESDHAAMRMGNMFMEALGLNARFAFGHGMASRFDLNGDPNPLDANANAGHDANVNINRPLVNANIGDIANANNVKIEANNDELGPVKVEAPEVHDAPYYGPGDTDSSSDDSIVVDELAPFPNWSSSEDEKVRVPFPAENRKRARKGNVAPDSKKAKIEFEEVNFGSKIVGLINELQSKDKKKKEKKARQSFEVLDLNKPMRGNKRRRDKDDDDDMSGTGLGFGGQKRARFMNEVC